MKIQPFQAIYPRLEFIASSDSFFGTVKKEYPEFKESGFFHKAAQEGIYIYQIQKEGRTYLGVVCTSDIEDYNEGKIIKHENTLPTLEQTQLQLFFKRRAAVKPVLLTYPRVSKIDSWLKNQIKNRKPILEITFEEEQAIHKFWEVCDGSKLMEIQSLFGKHVPKSYIADGHHRTSTAALLHKKMKKKEGDKYRYFLTSFFSFEELEILEFNRVVHGINNLEPEVFMAHLSRLFSIKFLKKPIKPKAKNELVMFFNKNWYRLKWKKKILNQYKKEPAILDANLLNDKVLSSLLGIEDARNDKRIRYVEGPKGLDFFEKVISEKPLSVGFLLPPVQMDDFLAIADASQIMPPKSTWFEPRMKNGVLVHEP